MKLVIVFRNTLLSFLLTSFFGVVQATDFTVNQIFDDVDADPGNGICATANGVCTLRAAVMESNALMGADIINVPAGTYTLDIDGTFENQSTKGDLDILDDLTIIGADSATTIINSSYKYRLISVLKRNDLSLPEVSISNLTLTQGIYSTDGALVFNEGELILDNIILTDANNNNNIPAMVNEGNFTLKNSLVSNNFRGIQSNSGTATIISSEFSNHDSPGIAGGALKLIDTTSLVTGSIFTTNKSQFGGAISVQGSSSLELQNCTFNGNISNNHGGAIYSSGAIVITDSEFMNNIASANGGAIYSNNNVLMTNIDFSDNSASRGGAVSLNGSQLATLLDSTFTNNSGYNSGGGIYAIGVGELRIKRVTMTGNQASLGSGGGVYEEIGQDGIFNVSDSIFSSNHASYGGGIYLTEEYNAYNTQLDISHSEISLNTAEISGGGIYVNSNNVTLNNITISGNDAAGTEIYIGGCGGGGLLQALESQLYTLELVHVTIANNTVASNTGSNISNYRGVLNIRNSLIANPMAGVTNCEGSVTSLGYNLSSDDSCNLNNGGDKININPLLGSLVDNGGFTRTLALSSGSSAIDSGDALFCASQNPLDQRYNYRGDLVCDIGAYEANSVRAQSGTLTFSAESITVNESDGLASITISRSGGSEGNVGTSFYDTELGTAHTGFPYNDYDSIPSTSLEWVDGDSADKTIDITIFDDIEAEDDETILLKFNGVYAFGGASQGISTTVITIVDDEAGPSGELQFANTNITVNETDGTGTATVTRSNGSTGTVTIDYIANFDLLTSPATNGTDFNLTAGTLTFADGVTSQTITFSIIDDLVQEGDEDFWIDLSNATGGATIGADWFTGVTITDNDIGTVITDPGVITIETALYTVSEDVGTMTFNLLRSNGTDSAVTVDVTFEDGSALFGDDYSAGNQSFTVTFQDGESSISETISINDDSIEELEEAFIIRISNPQGGATLGSITGAAVAITDNDSSSTDTSSDSGGGGGAMHPALLFGMLFLTLGIRRRKQQ